MSDAETTGAGGAEHATAVLTHMTRSLVDHPDEVNVDVVDLDDRLELNVSVADGDMGRVIGKRGRMANAIRVVTRAAAVRDGVEVDIEFVD
ncbi:MAG: KH domain-containing protein [Microthrixaceae bacterium]|nr:KH domain-containing protein [Microthrixaceae bacterium]